jgi:hypothetical protein
MSTCSRRGTDSKPQRAERSVEFSAVPLAGLTTALRGAPLKRLVPFDKPQHEPFVKAKLPGINALHGKNRCCRDRHRRRSYFTTSVNTFGIEP